MRANSAEDASCLEKLDDFINTAESAIRSRAIGQNDPASEIAAQIKRNELGLLLKRAFAKTDTYTQVSLELEFLDTIMEFVDTTFGKVVNSNNRDEICTSLRNCQRRMNTAIHKCMRRKLSSWLMGHHNS